jgi:hypothetical protein
MGEQAKTTRFGLRLPTSMYYALVEQARENDRSVNSEIIERLRDSLEMWQRLSGMEQKLVETLERAKDWERRLEPHVQRVLEKVPSSVEEVGANLRKNAKRLAESRGLDWREVIDVVRRAIEEIDRTEERQGK